jgi:hypothetical protein
LKNNFFATFAPLREATVFVKTLWQAETAATGINLQAPGNSGGLA